MTYYEPTFHFERDTDGAFAPDELVEFYRHNGYRLVDDGSDVAVLRGTPHAGWWTSRMTGLHTRVVIDDDPSGPTLRYRIQTTGQHMTDDDRQFFEREADAAFEYAFGDGPLVDLRDAEARRAREIRREMRSTGLEAAAIIFFMIFAAGVIAHFLGWF